MSQHRRVIWSEGMLLSPQHLQQWDRYTHHLVSERLRASQAFVHGFTHLEIDRDAIGNGRFALAGARGVLPDGTPFAAPEDDPLPPARAIEPHFGTKQESVRVSLGLPSVGPGRAQLGRNGGAEVPTARYTADTLELADDNEGANERPITVARRNLAILFPDDPVAEYDALPAAELVRAADGTFALRDTFVPPCLAVGASEALMRQLRAELEMLIAKSSSLGDKRRQRGGVADFASTDAASFWLLRTVNAYIPALAHFVGHRRAHPEQVYVTLASLAGELCTFSPDQHPKDLPPYEHGALAATFAGIHVALTSLLEFYRDEKSLRIDLTKGEGFLFHGRLADERLFAPGASLFLGARAELEEQQLVQDLPAKVKIGSRDKIDFLIAAALRGVPLTFTRVPPASLPVKSNFVYFQLDPNCDAWEEIKGAKNIAIYAPDLPGLTLELLGLRA